MLPTGKSTRPPAGRADPATGPPRQGALVERIAGWSIRHRLLAITGWFALVIVAVLSSALMPETR